MLSDVRRFDDATVIIELFQLVEEPAAAGAARAELRDFSIRLSEGQVYESCTMRFAQNRNRLVYINVPEAFLIFDRSLTGRVKRQASVYRRITVLL